MPGVKKHDLFDCSNFEHIGAVPFVQGHGCGIDDYVARLQESGVFEDFGNVNDRFVRACEPVVVETAHAPDEVQGGEHVHPVGKNIDMDIVLWTIAGDFEGGIAGAGHSNDCFGTDFLSSFSCAEADCIGEEGARIR